MEFIGIDVGSQGTKFTVIDQAGNISAEEFIEYPIQYPRPFWAQQDPREWEEAVVEGLRSIAQRLKNPEEVVAIGIDAQVDGIVAIDKDYNPLNDAIIWMDRRATAEEESISEVISGEDIFSITGCNLDASHVLPKLLWLRRNITNFNQSYKFLLPASYVLLFLTGEFGIDYSNASTTLFFDINRRVWSNEILKEFGIDISLLPDVYPSTYGIGKLKRDITKKVGLKEGIIVAVGCGDEHAACVGAGAIEEGIVFDITGTAEGVGASSTKPLLDKSKLVETHGHASAEHWFLENPGFVSGGNLRWLRDNLCRIERSELSYEDLTKAAEKVPRGSQGIVFLPTLMGAMVPEWNSYAKGNIFGFSMNCTWSHIARAILEASAYGIRDVVEALRNMGLEFTKVRVTGGGSRSDLWNQIKADVLNLSIETLTTSETTSFGAALIGAVAFGVFSDLKSAANSTIKVKQIIPPQEGREVYDEMYQLYRDVYYSLKPLFKR